METPTLRTGDRHNLPMANRRLSVYGSLQGNTPTPKVAIMYRHIPTPEAQDTVKGSKVRTVFKWLLFALTCFISLAFGGVLGFLLWSVFALSAMGYYTKAPRGPRQMQRNYYAARYGPNPRAQAQEPTHDPLHPYDNL